MFESPAYAQAAGGAAASGGGAAFFIQMVPLLAIFVIFWFLLIRPQQRRLKEHQAKVTSVKKGDTVVTGGGLVGKVTKVEDAHVEVELAPQVRVRAVKSTLTDVTPLGGSKPAND
jgi:preprotein translocase subunit YajC